MSSAEYTFTLGEVAKKFAEEKLNETDEKRNEAVKEIRNWLKENPRIHADDEYKTILPFIRNCKYDLDKAKKKLKNYYVMRSEVPEWFNDRNPELPAIKELVKLGVFVPLKNLHENKLVVIIRTAAHDPKRHSQNDVFKAGKMILDIATRENELVQLYGVIAIFDMNGVSLGHAVQLKPPIIKKAVHAWQNYHVSPKQLEFINAPVYINVVLKVFKSFMSEKLRNRVNVHFNGLGSLPNRVPKHILPSDYGGNNESIAFLAAHWYEKLVENKSWFKYNEQFKADM